MTRPLLRHSVATMRRRARMAGVDVGEVALRRIVELRDEMVGLARIGCFPADPRCWSGHAEALDRKMHEYVAFAVKVGVECDRLTAAIGFEKIDRARRVHERHRRIRWSLLQADIRDGKIVVVR